MFCDLFGHSMQPYRYNVVEYIPQAMNPKFNREGSHILSHVYCTRCGHIKEVFSNGENVRLVDTKRQGDS